MNRSMHRPLRTHLLAILAGFVLSLVGVSVLTAGTASAATTYTINVNGTCPDATTGITVNISVTGYTPNTNLQFLVQMDDAAITTRGDVQTTDANGNAFVSIPVPTTAFSGTYSVNATTFTVERGTFSFPCGPVVPPPPPCPAPVLSFTVSSNVITVGDKVTISWSAPGAKTLVAKLGSLNGSVPLRVLSGSISLWPPAGSYTLSLTATNSCGKQTTVSNTVTVSKKPTPPRGNGHGPWGR